MSKEDIAKMEPTKDGVPLTLDEVIDLLAGVDDINHDVPRDAEQEPVPDHSIGIPERNLYGYIHSEMLLLQDKCARELFDEGYPVYLLYLDGTRGQALERRELKWTKRKYMV